MTPISDQVEAVLREGLTPLLRREGFKKTRQVWRKQAGEVVHITCAETSDQNGGVDAKLTLSLGVYFPAVDELGKGPPAETKPLPRHCVIQLRMGELMPAPGDHWWKIESETDAEKLGGEIAEAWLAFGKPWLEAHSEPANAQKFLVQKGDLYWAAVFALYRTNDKEARRLLKKALDSSEAAGSQYAAHLRAWGNTHGLL